MQNPLASRRAALNYAILSLVVRLIASQAGVFNLWYGRRAYERSRGELITMLYEKTLSRKVVSVSSKPVVDVDLDEITIANGHGNGHVKFIDLTRSQKVWRFLAKPFSWMSRKKVVEVEKKKGFASLGKILNLMRYVIFFLLKNRIMESSI